jgi:hypothetical protein
MDAITGLLAERQRYESWIATLETRRGSTPPHVYARVRADYEKRLIAVMEQLAGRTSELESTVTTLTSKVAAITDEETTRRDERAEAELRAAVGEFAPEQWAELSHKSEEEIARLEALRAEVSGELAQVQDLLLQATRKSDALTPAEPVDVVAPSAPAAPPADRRVHADPPVAAPSLRAVPLAAAPASAPGAESSVDFDELAFLNSVVEPRDGGAGRAPAAPSAVTTRPAPVGDGTRSLADELGAMMAADLEGAPPRSAAPGAPAAPARRPQPAAPASPTEYPPADDRRRMSNSVPAFLKDVPSEQVKTLKCQECGTMNYPTEWYCERCGGELAAM